VIKNNSGAILSLTERKTNFIMLEKLKHGKNAEELTKTVFRLLIAYKKTSSYDNKKQWNRVC